MLLKLGYASEEAIARAVAKQYDLPFIRVEAADIPVEVARTVNASYAQKQKIVPVTKIGNTLTLAMAQPLTVHELEELEELESSVKLRLIPVIAAESEILLAHQRVYRMGMSEPKPEEDARSFVLIRT